jgi:hypothetical protein
VTDTQLIEEVNAALDEATAPQRLPAGAAARARARARARRRLTRGLPAVGLAAAAALLLAVVVPHLLGRTAVQGQPRSNQGAPSPALLTVSYVTSREQAAARGLSNVIIKTSQNGQVTWSDPATEMNRYQVSGPGGKLISDELEQFTGGVIKPPAAVGQTQHRLYVDYATRTWWQLTAPAPKVMKDTPVSGTLPVPADNSGGQVSILGHRTVDGQDTIEVKYAPPRGFKPAKYSLWPTEYVWLNATTYLPVRTQIYGLGPVQTADLAYLPVTQANLAIFKLTPPAGFTRVAPPPFRGDGQPGLGQIP